MRQPPDRRAIVMRDSSGDLKNGALTLFTYQGGKRVKLEVIR